MVGAAVLWLPASSHLLSTHAASMSDPFASAIGGGLKLKSGPGVAAGGVKKRDKPKKAKPAAEAAAAQGAAAAAQGGTAAGEAPPPSLRAAPDRRTEAERRHDERVAKEEQRLIAKMAAKTHREKVQEFNVYLAKLSEHHDIPRVGPG